MQKRPFYHMDFGVIKLLLMIFVALGALAIVGLDIAILVGAIVTGFPEVAWASLVAGVLAAAATVVIMVFSGYRFDDDKLCVVLGVFKDKLPYADIVQLKRDADTGVYYIISGDIQTGTCVRVNISRDKGDSFIAELRKHVPAIPVETFVIPKKDEQK